MVATLTRTAQIDLSPSLLPISGTAPPAAEGQTSRSTERHHWVEIAKGLCIVLVILMHATLGLEAILDERGFLHPVADFAQPFRMPTFFALSGLFLASALRASWRSFLDRRVLHYLYFYGVWLLIEGGSKVPYRAAEGRLLELFKQLAIALVEPFSTLWFLYALAIFAIVTRLLQRVPGSIVFLGAIFLSLADVKTGWHIFDVCCMLYCYFYAGYLFSKEILAAGAAMQRRLFAALAVTIAWACVTGVAAFSDSLIPNAPVLASDPVIHLALGFIGVIGVAAVSTLLARSSAGPVLTYIGKRSLVVYLAAFFPIAIVREIIVRTGGADFDVGLSCLILTFVGVAAPLAAERIIRGTRAALVFERPDATRLDQMALLMRGAVEKAGAITGHARSMARRPLDRRTFLAKPSWLPEQDSNLRPID